MFFLGFCNFILGVTFQVALEYIGKIMREASALQLVDSCLSDTLQRIFKRPSGSSIRFPQLALQSS